MIGILIDKSKSPVTMPVVRYKHDRNEVNCFCKYMLFVANFILWVSISLHSDEDSRLWVFPTKHRMRNPRFILYYMKCVMILLYAFSSSLCTFYIQMFRKIHSQYLFSVSSYSGISRWHLVMERKRSFQ
jgi:hypothetical protein